jgi:hypothetical protein
MIKRMLENPRTDSPLLNNFEYSAGIVEFGGTWCHQTGHVCGLCS